MWSKPDPSLPDLATVYIKNLDRHIEPKDLYELFSGCGAILTCGIGCDKGGQSLGDGFVHFEIEHAANQAIKVGNNRSSWIAEILANAEVTRIHYHNTAIKGWQLLTPGQIPKASTLEQ